jgi:choline dehydrogenase
MPVACAAMQLNPETDWMYTADAGRAGLGLNGRRVPVSHGRMLGDSSAINYMAHVRGDPGDFDAWAAGGAAGWSCVDVLLYFRKSEGLDATGDAVIDAAAQGRDGPLGVSACAPVLDALPAISLPLPRPPAIRAVTAMARGARHARRCLADVGRRISSG